MTVIRKITPRSKEAFLTGLQARIDRHIGRPDYDVKRYDYADTELRDMLTRAVTNKDTLEHSR